MHVTWRKGKSSLALEFKPGAFVVGVICFQQNDQHIHPVEKGLCVHRARALNISVMPLPMVTIHLVWYHHETQNLLAMPDMSALPAMMAEAFKNPMPGFGGFPDATTLN